MMRSIVLATAFSLACGSIMCGSIAQAQAPSAPGAEALTDKDVPASVSSRFRCGKPAGPVTVRAFAGGFVFAQPCLSGSDVADRLVFASDRNGAGAHLLQFVRPEGRRVSALGNVAFKQDGMEISGTVGRLSRRICRAEGAWRLEGKFPQPALVFWRHTRDCDGKTGWQTMVNRKR